MMTMMMMMITTIIVITGSHPKKDKNITPISAHLPLFSSSFPQINGEKKRKEKKEQLDLPFRLVPLLLA